MPKSKSRKIKKLIQSDLEAESLSKDKSINTFEQDTNLVSEVFLTPKSNLKVSFWERIKFKNKEKIVNDAEKLQIEFDKLSDQDKILYSIDQKLKKSITNFQYLIYFVVLLVIGLQFGIFWFVQKSQPNFNFFQNQTESKTAGIEKQSLSREYETKSINTFSGNDAIVDLGSNLTIKEKFIEVKKTTDCKTQVVPSPESGCGFSILTSSMGFNDPGVILRSIRFKADLNQEDKIDLAIKNFEKGTISQSIATISQADLTKKTPLPSVLSPVESLFIRFWGADKQVKIHEIILEYSSVDNLKVIEGDFDSGKVANQKAFIYADEDENEQLSKAIDTEWRCQLGFPGVQPIEIDNESKFKILRDDSCYIGPKPLNWNEDNQIHSLPAGKWLMVMDGKVFPFEIKTEDQELSLNLEYK
jgi:hypothetical protein